MGVFRGQGEVAGCDGGAADPDLALRVGRVGGEVGEGGAVDQFDFDGAGGWPRAVEVQFAGSQMAPMLFDVVLV